jgi:hypothetical protein
MADDQNITFVGVVCAVAGAVGKSLWDRYLKKQDGIEKVYQKYRDPLILAAIELASRLSEISDKYPTVYLRTDVFNSKPEFQEMNSIGDPYFRKYKLASTVYRFCAFFGWLELFRKDAIYLHIGKNLAVEALENCSSQIRADIADGQLNDADDWERWKDILIFREELRAIGEAMIDEKDKTVIGYGSFCELFEAPKANRWIKVATSFFLDLESTDKDFRKIRIQRLAIHLVDLIQLLDSSKLNDRLDKIREKEQKELLQIKMHPL